MRPEAIPSDDTRGLGDRLAGARVQLLKQVGGASRATGRRGPVPPAHRAYVGGGFGDVQRGLEVALLRRQDSALGV